jgi:type I restriction enzyme M protein
LVVFAFAPVAIGVFTACLWFLRREKNSHSKEILFIDATEMGFMKDRVHRDLAPEDIAKIMPLRLLATGDRAYVASKQNWHCRWGVCRISSVHLLAKYQHPILFG